MTMPVNHNDLFNTDLTVPVVEKAVGIDYKKMDEAIEFINTVLTKLDE